MRKSDKHIKESVVFAVAMAAFAFTREKGTDLF
jgi:hypothetical protein